MKDPRPPQHSASKDQRRETADESSVVISLQELVRLERTRVEDEARSKIDRENQASAARLAGEQRRVEDERAREAAEAERRRQGDLRRRMDDAQIEAAKLAELENRKLAQQQKLHLARLAAEEEHERAMVQLRAAQKKPFPTGLVVGVASMLTALAIAVVLVLAIRRTAPVPTADGTAAEERAAERLAADQRAAEQDKKMKDLLDKLEQQKNQPPPVVSAPAPTTKTPPVFKPLPKAPPKEDGCGIEVAGVPMCAKKK